MSQPLFDRRHFLQAGAAGLAALPGLAAARPPAAPPAFELGAQTYTFRNFNTEQALVRMKKLGLRYAELYQKHAPLESTPAQIKALLRLCRDYDVTPRAWGVQNFSKNHGENRRAFDFAKALGLKMLSANPTLDSFASLDKLCAEYNIAIGIHPHGPTGRIGLHTWFSAEVILKIVKDHHPLVGSCLDTGHLIRCAQLGVKLDPAQQIRLMGARNFGIHLKDHDNARHTDVVFGKGPLNVRSVIDALRAVRFAGMISIEYEASPDEPTADVRACVQAFNEAARPR
jgi:sugar phosphate isomerase/epimerase